MAGMRKCRLSPYKQERLVELFVAGSTARRAGSLCGVHRNTAAFFFQRLRKIVALETAAESRALFQGEVEVDESYFGGRRKGRRGRGAAGKIPVFGILKRGGKVYTQMVPNVRRRTLEPILEAKVAADSVVYTDGLSSYDALDVSRFRHYRINHSKRFSDGRRHINGIENFWSQAKRFLRQYNGLKKEHFELFLKECEWRFNYSELREQRKQLNQWVRKHLQ